MFFKIFEKLRKSYKNMKMRTLENMLCRKRLKELNNVSLLKSVLKGASIVVCKWIHTEKILGIKVLCNLA